MNYIKTKDGILLKDVQEFEPEHIFECGQCFRWNRTPDGGYKGTAGKRNIRIKRVDPGILFYNIGEREFCKYWVDYFDLGRDYGYIKKILSEDPVLKKAAEYGSGIRILKQDVWETLVSFIISANNNIKRIKNTIERLCHDFGEKLTSKDEIYFAFPTPDRLAEQAAQNLRACGCGYRAEYILRTAKIVAGGDVNLYSLEKMNTKDVRNILLSFPGVGPKVADCIMLFSMAKLDVFPVDVWVKRVMEHFYLREGTPLPKIHGFATEIFGPFAGMAQQYLFYYAKNIMGRTPDKR